MFNSIAYAQKGEIALQWNYPVDEEQYIAHFILQEKNDAGVYEDIENQIDPSIREYVVTRLKPKDKHCYRMIAQQEGMNIVRSDPSNEVCGKGVRPVDSLQIKRGR